jgi:putative DNA primase/helicase
MMNTTQPHTFNLAEFHGWLAATHQLEIDGELVADGQFHYYHVKGDKHGKKTLRASVHLDEPPNVYFQDFKRCLTDTWQPLGNTPLSAAGRAAILQAREANRRQREAQEQVDYAKAAAKALGLWAAAGPADPAHPYLRRKGVAPHGIRQAAQWVNRRQNEHGIWESLITHNALLVPLRDASGTLWNVQALFPAPHPILERDKDFIGKGRKQGLMHWIGGKTRTILIAEGYATAASLHASTGYRVFVAFDAGNLPAVAATVRQHCPDSPIVLCADHDAPDKRGRQVGQEKAHEAAKQVKGYVALPPLIGDDFNDWQQKLMKGEGRPALIKAYIDNAIANFTNTQEI